MTARALLVSSRVSVTPMVGPRRCSFRVWVRVREVFGLLWALRDGFPARADHCLLALSVLGGRSWWRVMSLVGLPRVLLQVLGVGVVRGAALAPLVVGADGGLRDWWWRWRQWQWGCRLLLRLPSLVSRFVLVIVSLVVQMVRDVGDAGVVRRRGDAMADPYPGGGVAYGTV